MIPATVGATDTHVATARPRRRRFGLDTALPADPLIVARAVRRHLATCRPDALVLDLSRAASADADPAKRVNVAAGVPDMLLLLPEGRAAFLIIKTQAQTLSRAERAFADLCRDRAIPVEVVRSLPEARQALDRLGLVSRPEPPHAIEEDRVARRFTPRPSPARP